MSDLATVTDIPEELERLVGVGLSAKSIAIALDMELAEVRRLGLEMLSRQLRDVSAGWRQMLVRQLAEVRAERDQILARFIEKAGSIEGAAHSAMLNPVYSKRLAKLRQEERAIVSQLGHDRSPQKLGAESGMELLAMLLGRGIEEIRAAAKELQEGGATLVLPAENVRGTGTS